MKPCGQEEARSEAEQNRHRAAADLAGARRSRARSSSVIRNRQRGLGLGLDREGRRVRGRLAGPSRSSPLGWTDRWAQTVSPAFLIVLIQKPLRKP
jgi:hypothetical protein